MPNVARYAQADDSATGRPIGAAGFIRRVVITCGDALMAHQLGARELGASVVVDPTLAPAEVLVAAERID